jgi:hypothetical protein
MTLDPRYRPKPPPVPIAQLRINEKNSQVFWGDMFIYHEAGPQGQSVQTWSWQGPYPFPLDIGTWVWVKNTLTGLIFVELKLTRPYQRSIVVGNLFKDSWQGGPVPPPGRPFYQFPNNGVNWQAQVDDGTIEFTLPNGKVLEADWVPYP